MEKLGLPVREFIYFDRGKVEDFVSALVGGLPEERKEAHLDTAATFDAKVKVPVFEADRRGGTRQLTREEVLKATDASLFERLHQVLADAEAIQMLEAFDAEIWEQLEAAELVEVHCRVEFSALEELFDLIRRLKDLIELFSPAQADDRQLRSIIAYLDILDREREAYNVRIVPVGAPSARFVFVASLSKNQVRGRKEELANECFAFGRVQRKLAKNEKFELFSLMPKGIRLPREQIRDFLTKFKDMPSILGTPPTIRDFQVSYPAIILTPVAIYR